MKGRRWEEIKRQYCIKVLTETNEGSDSLRRERKGALGRMSMEEMSDERDWSEHFVSEKEKGEKREGKESVRK